MIYVWFSHSSLKLQQNQNLDSTLLYLPETAPQVSPLSDKSCPSVQCSAVHQMHRNRDRHREAEKSRAASIVESLGRHFQVQELIPPCGQVDAAIRFLLASGLWIFRWHLHNSVTASVVELDYCPLPLLLLVFNSQRRMVARDVRIGSSGLSIANDTALFLLLLVLRSLCKINNSYWVDKFIRKSTGRRAVLCLAKLFY